MAAFDLRLETTHATLHREDGFSEERRSQCWGGRAEPGPARAAGGAVRCAASASPAAQRNPCPLREVVSDPPESLTGSLRGRAVPRLHVCPEERKAGSAGVCRTASTAGQMSPGWPLADHDAGRSAGEPSHGACWHVGEPCTRARGITRRGRRHAAWGLAASRGQEADRPPRAGSRAVVFSFRGRRISTWERKFWRRSVVIDA